MRKFWDFMYGCRYILPGVLAAFVAAGSLSGYQAPVYAAPETTAAQETAAASLESEIETETTIAEGSFDVADGTYQGEGTGYGGKIAVTVTVAGGKITAITVDSASGEDSAFFNRAKAVIDRILEAQSLDVDTVSGATYSSRGILSAVKNALTGEADSNQTAAQTTSSRKIEMETEAEADGYKDGTYTGSAQGFGGTISVKVTIKNGKIKKISVTECSGEGTSYMNKARKLIKKMIKKQSTDVDTVSGATYSSAGLINAVRNALKKAAVDGTEEETTETETEKETKKSGDSPYADGIFYGTGEGFRGEMEVGVVIVDGEILAILVTKSEDDDTFLNKAKALLDDIIEKQTTKKVDTVSGATYSSKGLLQAVKDALKQSKKQKKIEDGEETSEEETLEEETSEEETSPEETLPEESSTAGGGSSEESGTGEDSSETGSGTETTTASTTVAYKYKNGTYSVSTKCNPDEDDDFSSYTLKGSVTIENDRIVSITDLKGTGMDSADKLTNNACIKSAEAGVVQQITALTSLDDLDTVEAVSHATCSSNAIIALCKAALKKAAN